MDSLERRAYAKVNLGLDIVGIREDGYHLVRMIMQTVGIYDVLTFRKTKEPGVVLRISEKSTLPDISDVPTDNRNLIVRAAKKMLERYQAKDGETAGVEITLEKHIPMAAGMAGGSTDCAAALRGVAELFELGCSEKELAEIGVSLGADVPYCLMGGTALSEGIGEKLTKLPDLPKCRMLIIKPEFGASTKEVYGAYDSLDPDEIDHPDIDGMVVALNEGNLPGVCARLGNVLELVTARLHPEITKIEEMFMELGVKDTIMTGSGPTVFGVLREELKKNEEELKQELIGKLEKAGIPARVYAVDGTV